MGHRESEIDTRDLLQSSHSFLEIVQRQEGTRSTIEGESSVYSELNQPVGPASRNFGPTKSGKGSGPICSNKIKSMLVSNKR
jgi:hypothetical protein